MSALPSLNNKFKLEAFDLYVILFSKTCRAEKFKLLSQLKCELGIKLRFNLRLEYRGFSPYAAFGTWKKTALAKNRISKIFILCMQ